MKSRKLALIISFFALFAFASACDDDDPVEDAVDEITDSVEDAAEEIEDGVEEAAEEVESAGK